MAKIYVTSSKSKGKISNEKNKFKEYLMTRIVHTISLETVLT